MSPESARYPWLLLTLFFLPYSLYMTGNKNRLIMYSCLSFQVLPYSLTLYPFSFLFLFVRLIIPFTCRNIFSFSLFLSYYAGQTGRCCIATNTYPTSHHIFLVLANTCLVLFRYIDLLFPFVLCLSCLELPAIHTYIHHTLMFPCCIHGWEKQSTHASSSFFFFFFFFLFLVLFCFLFLLPEQSF